MPLATKKGTEMGCFDEEPDAPLHGECEAEITRLTGTISAMTKWLEENQPDVFRRGLWDAISKIGECSTCGGTGTIDVRLGGEWNSDPSAKCPDCGGG